MSGLDFRRINVSVLLIQCLETHAPFWESCLLGDLLDLFRLQDLSGLNRLGWDRYPRHETALSDGKPFPLLTENSDLPVVAKRIPVDANAFDQSFQQVLPESSSCRVVPTYPEIWICYDNTLSPTLTVTLDVTVEVTRDALSLGNILFEKADSFSQRTDTGLLALVHESPFGKGLLDQARKDLSDLVAATIGRRKPVPKIDRSLVHLSYGKKIVHSVVFLGGDCAPDDLLSVANCDSFLEATLEKSADSTISPAPESVIGWSFSVFSARDKAYQHKFHTAMFHAQRIWFFTRRVKSLLDQFSREYFLKRKQVFGFVERANLCEALLLRYQSVTVAYRMLKDNSNPKIGAFLRRIESTWLITDIMSETKQIMTDILAIYDRQLRRLQIRSVQRQKNVLNTIAILQVCALSSLAFNYYHILSELPTSNGDGLFWLLGGRHSPLAAEMIEWTPLGLLIGMFGMLLYFFLAGRSSHSSEAEDDDV